ncbi:unnamed protein product [Danaus chrysippus]|uniref:(African queen) hypothetical protein n=1 Tax=Danaus chrysippus TaxID=151541 RepID=A0A8J2R9P4_9NEOP|nr:unnamed protein product [Danaus chrysippus]
MGKGIFAEEKEVMCYVACIMKMANAIKNNKLNYEAAIKQADLLLPDEIKEPAKEAITACKKARTDQEIRRWFLQLAVECSKEHPVTKEELQMLKDHKIPDDKNVKCLMACVFRKVDWLDSNGMFKVDSAYKLSEEEYPDDKTKLDNAKNLYSLCEKGRVICELYVGQIK